MKRMRKFLAAVISAVALLVMAVPETAAVVSATEYTPVLPGTGGFTFTITDAKEGHTYSAYQIFAGDLAKNGSDLVLSNISWGSSITVEDQNNLLNELKNDTAFVENGSNIFNSCTDAASLAEAIPLTSKRAYLASVINKHVSAPAGSTSEYDETHGKYTIKNLQAGYYLVKDTGMPIPNGDSATHFIVKIVENTTAKPKSVSVPTVVKQVADNGTHNDYKTDSTAAAPNYGESPSYQELVNFQWYDSADHDIGDEIPYQLNAQMPDQDTLAAYTAYKVVFHDSLSSGLDFIEGSLYLFIGFEGSENYSAIPVVPQTQYETLSDKEKTGKFWYSYTTDQANLNYPNKLEIGCDNILSVPVTGGEHIKAFYKAKLNEKAVIGGEGNPNEVLLEYSSNTGDMSTEMTKKDKVVVFTYQLVVNKVDGENAPLKGADFLLEKKYFSFQAKAGQIYDDKNKSIISPEAGFDYIQDIDNGKVSKIQQNTSFDTSKYVKLTALENPQQKNDVWVEVTRKTGLQEGTAFKFDGLDDGYYRLTEIKTPTGYNSIDPVFFTIKADHVLEAENPQLNSLTLTRTKTDGGDEISGSTVTGENGILSTSVVNKRGISLPSTGGMGTTIFYVAGSLMVVGAGIVLVTRRCVNAGKRAGRKKR